MVSAPLTARALPRRDNLQWSILWRCTPVRLQGIFWGGSARSSGSRGHPIWYSARPCRALSLGTFDGGDAEL